MTPLKPYNYYDHDDEYEKQPLNWFDYLLIGMLAGIFLIPLFIMLYLIYKPF